MPTGLRGVKSTIQKNTFAKLQWCRNRVLRLSDGKARIKLVTPTYTMSCNVQLQDNTRHTVVKRKERNKT
jgi:hypothetical protein